MVLSLVAAPLVLVIAALAWLATPTGGAWLRGLVVEKADAAIAGTLAVRALSLRGGHLVVDGVELRDPDGGLVASVARLEVRLRLAALVHRRVDVALVRVDAPDLRLRLDERGSNLARAVSARNPAPPEPQTPRGGGGPELAIERVEIRRGTVDVLQRASGTSRHVHLEGLETDGSARMAGETLAARLALSANVAAPVDRPLRLTLDATGAGARKEARLSVELGSARLVAAGKGTSVDDLTGRLELDVPPTSVEGETMGPVHLLATASGGEVEVPGLRVELPGVRIDARGRGSKERLALRGTLAASDLGAFGRTLARLGGPELSVKGRGELAFAVGGSVEHPSVALDAGFPTLERQGTRIDGLTLHLSAPDLKAPTSARARVTARTVALAPAKVFRALDLEVEGEGREVALGVAVHGYAELGVRARATVDPDGHGGRLDALSVRYPEAQWVLEAPVRIASRDGALEVSPFALRSGRQAISGRLLQRGPDVDAAVALRALDLGRLPRAFVDPALALGGILELDAGVRGSRSRPEARARVDLSGGRFRGYRDVRLHVDASYARDRARGSLAAEAVGVRLNGSFDVPVKALRSGGRAPVRAELRTSQLRLEDAFRSLGTRAPISGLVRAEASLRGTADDPRLDVAVNGRELRVRNAPVSRLDVVARSAADGRLGARVDLALAGKESFVAVDTPFTLGELLRRPPAPAALLAAALRVEAELRELPLALLSEAGMSDRRMTGTVSAHAHVTGTPLSPRGELTVRARGVGTEGVPPVDALLGVQLGDELHADVRAERDGRALLTATARLGAEPGQLRSAEHLARTPLAIEANVGPLPVSELQAATQPTDEDPALRAPPLRGTITGRLAWSGTLQDPRVGLRVAADGLGAEGRPAGKASVGFDYANARENLELVASSHNGGALRVGASANVDLSYPTVKSARLDAAPVSATLQAKDFDPTFLSGLSSAVHKLAGLMEADARADGTLGAPAVKGRLEWKDGVLSTDATGELTNIHLLATGDNDRVQLQELTARSGGGKAKLSALATRTGGRSFQLHAAADLDRFPLLSQGQVVATLSLRSTADGEVSPAAVAIRKLDIPEAHVDLPDVQKRNLQKLEDPPDVVLTLNGKPIRGSKQPVAAAAAAGGTGSGGDAGEESAVSAGTGRPESQLTVLVNAPRNLWIQGNDVSTELGLSDGFRVEYATEPKIFGDVNVVRGRVDVFGRRFDLQRDSKVSFSGQPAKPALDVTAKYKNEVEQVTVTLTVQGEPGSLQLHPTSDPPLSETEIYTLLATGHTTLQGGSGAATSVSGQAASIVGSVAASQLQKTLSNKLPLDVLSVQAGDNGLQGTKLEAGTYVNDRLYVGFTGRVGADPMKGENSNQVNLEYQLSKHWSVNGSYGDARAGDAGVNWRKEY